jgi:hypothetical protein
MQDQETKQAKLYDYIRSREFYRQIEALCDTHTKMSDLLKKERKDHETLWKKREALLKQLLDAYIDIGSGIDTIMQDQPKDDKDPVDMSNGDGKGGDHLQNKIKRSVNSNAVL